MLLILCILSALTPSVCSWSSIAALQGEAFDTSHRSQPEDARAKETMFSIATHPTEEPDSAFSFALRWSFPKQCIQGGEILV